MARGVVRVLLLVTALACDGRSNPTQGVATGSIVEIPLLPTESPVVSRVIYLNREGATLTAGPDDAATNRSMVVQMAEQSSFDVPPYAGSARQFAQIVGCVRGHFERYDVTVVDRRPIDPGYMMVVVGGRAGALAQTQARGEHSIGGLAPYNGQAVKNAVVLAFAEIHGNRPRAVCDTAAQEIAHAYGLDHTRHCADLMSYMRPCGRRRFVEDAVPCGESDVRPCGDGAAAQSSHRRLLEVLGPAR